MSSIKDKILGAFRRGHPDVYKAIQEYAEKQGISVADAIAAASSAYVMASGDEGKARLEELMEERRTTSPKKSGADLKDSIGQVTELLNALGGVFGALNEVRSTLSVKSVVEDYKTLKESVKTISEEGEKGGAGSIDDVIAKALVNRILGGGELKLPTKKKTGEDAGSEKKVEE